jgi:hypothetical protein
MNEGKPDFLYLNTCRPARLIVFAVTLFLWTVAVHSKDASAADQRQLRAAITMSLGFLEKEGDVWMGERDCKGRHPMPALPWSHREAKRRGLRLDEKLFNTQFDAP